MADGIYPADFSFWFYVPNKGAAIFFSVGFLVSTTLHLWQSLHYKYLKVTGLFVLSGLLNLVGFALRVLGGFGYHNDKAVFIASSCFIYVVPPVLALANYDILGRVLYYVPYLSPIKPSRVLSTFGILSFTVEALTGIGASFSFSPNAPEDRVHAGKHIMRTSLALQLILNSSFLLLAAFFHRRCTREGLGGARGVRQTLITLYVSTGLLVARAAYRIAEHQALESVDRRNPTDLDPVVRDEWFFCVFESGLMLVNMVLWNVRHPRRYLPVGVGVYLDRDGRTEVELPPSKETRGGVAKIMELFGVGRMCHGWDKAAG
ncbi:related to Rtm1p [Cephalotrichum gorgonifer]|uniref:Related to Rtm1p n=1 Tax=Cephalotrichum gorgonifer TaxID=2041049 RepID=A0AAE8SXT7_9PEZI|nr:related to Rtm1p [Cephalotrichum gorgonifer]